MTYHSPTIGSAQLYSPVSTPASFDIDDHTATSVATVPNDSSISHHQPLTDNFARQLTYLRLSITDFCNFRCEYCLPNGYQGKRPDDELSVSEIATLIRGFAQVGTRRYGSQAVSLLFAVMSWTLSNHKTDAWY